MCQHAAGTIEVGKRLAAAQYSQLFIRLDPEAHEGVVVEQVATGPVIALGQAEHVGIEDGLTDPPQTRDQAATEEAATGEHEIVGLKELIGAVLAIYPSDSVAVQGGAQYPLTDEEGAAKALEAAPERILHPHADEGGGHGGDFAKGTLGELLQLGQSRPHQPQ